MTTYTIKSPDSIAAYPEIVDAVAGDYKALKPYIIKIRDLPNDDKPREKLVKSGPGALSVQELLAVLLTTGTQKEDVLAMSQRIIREYGEKLVLEKTNPLELSETLGIPLVKASQIIAAGELGRRFFEKKTGPQSLIRNARDVYEYAKDMRELPKEHLRGIYLDTHHRIIHDEVISMGTINANIIHPREVFRPALEYNAAGVILVHNHPSGVPTPSHADKEVTKQLIEAGKLIGIDLLDHVIVAKNDFVSIIAQL